MRTAVQYTPIRGYGSPIPTRTRSTAWTLSNGADVVLIDGRTGAVALDHIDVVEEPS